MRSRTALFLTAAALYVTGVAAADLPPRWVAMCTTWAEDGAQTYDGGCIVNATQEGPDSGRARIDLYNRPEPVDIAVGPGRCTLNGFACVKIPASRPDAYRYRSQQNFTLEFTRPPE